MLTCSLQAHGPLPRPHSQVRATAKGDGKPTPGRPLLSMASKGTSEQLQEAHSSADPLPCFPIITVFNKMQAYSPIGKDWGPSDQEGSCSPLKYPPSQLVSNSSPIDDKGGEDIEEEENFRRKLTSKSLLVPGSCPSFHSTLTESRSDYVAIFQIGKWRLRNARTEVIRVFPG